MGILAISAAGSRPPRRNPSESISARSRVARIQNELSRPRSASLVMLLGSVLRLAPRTSASSVLVSPAWSASPNVGHGELVEKLQSALGEDYRAPGEEKTLALTEAA